jgi:hypothetical protein
MIKKDEKNEIFKFRIKLHAWSLLLLSPSCFACIVQDFSDSDGGYALKNSCNYAVNVKYIFSESKPFSGSYTTLQAGQRTAERAKKNEGFRYYECRYPEVPQSMTGGCVK